MSLITETSFATLAPRSTQGRLKCKHCSTATNKSWVHRHHSSTAMSKSKGAKDSTVGSTCEGTSAGHPWAVVKMISHSPYYHAPKYYHAHDNERGGGLTWFQTQLVRTTCQIRYPSHVWDHCSTGQL